VTAVGELRVPLSPRWTIELCDEQLDGGVSVISGCEELESLQLIHNVRSFLRFSSAGIHRHP